VRFSMFLKVTGFSKGFPTLLSSMRLHYILYPFMD
jgi:hypothetical protein